MVDVFISYSRTDQARVARLAGSVARAGYSVWWDAELPPHKSYGDVITEKIGSAKAAIVIWSSAAAASEWVRAEADVARNQKKLIQASLDGAMPPMPFNQIQFASIGDWEGETDHPGWRKIQASLAELCGREAVPVEPAYPMPATQPPAQSSGSRWLVPLLGGVAVLGVVASAYLLLDDRQQITKVEQLESRPTPRPRFNLAAVIDDPDGFTNVRDKPSASGRIIDRVEKGEAFTTFSQTGDWWQIRTADDTTGWMSRSRIQLLKEVELRERPSPPATTAAAPPAETAASPVATGDLILPDSGTRLLTEADLTGLSREQLRLARNEIFARRGRAFRNRDLESHFRRFSWYRPEAGEQRVNAIEAANARFIQEIEQRR